MKFSLPEEKIATVTDRVQSKAERFFRPKTVIIIFSAIVLVLAAISTVVILKERAPSGVPDETVASDVPAPGASAPTEDVDLMLTFIDDSDKTILLLGVLHVDIRTQQFSIRYVSPLSRADVNNLNATMQAHYLQGGGSELLWAVSSVLGRDVARYLIFDDDDFIAMARLMGDHELTVETRTDYTYKGLSLTFEAGPQKMIPDVLCKYFTYLCESADQGGEAAVTDFLSYLATKLAFESTEPMDEHLTKAFGSMDGNVTAIDISAYAAGLTLCKEKMDRIDVICEGVS